MKATVLIPFRDKHDHKVVYSPGDVKEFDNDRVVALAARGLVKPLEEASKTEESADVKPAKGKGKGKGKNAKKDKEAPAEVAPEAEKVDADTDTDTEAEDTDADVENSTDKE